MGEKTGKRGKPGRPSGLTQKMRDFCHAYVRTNSATKAYLEAYDSNEQTARCEGTKLLQRDDVTEYIKEINKPTINRINNDRKRKRDILWRGIERCIAKEDESGAARYMDILNRMDAEYVNINHNIDDTNEKLSGLSTDQLKQLLSESTDSAESTESTEK